MDPSEARLWAGRAGAAYSLHLPPGKARQSPALPRWPLRPVEAAQVGARAHPAPVTCAELQGNVGRSLLLQFPSASQGAYSGTQPQVIQTPTAASEPCREKPLWPPGVTAEASLPPCPASSLARACINGHSPVFLALLNGNVHAEMKRQVMRDTDSVWNTASGSFPPSRPHVSHISLSDPSGQGTHPAMKANPGSQSSTNAAASSTNPGFRS